jgi:hypothetical protein
VSERYKSARMTVWEIIEAALARQFRPPRDQQWLASTLGITPQAVHGWKKEGVPARRFRDIATALGLTVDQLEGLAPLPWDRGWPFADVEPERYYGLTLIEKDFVQRRLLEALEHVERERQSAKEPQVGFSGRNFTGEQRSVAPVSNAKPAKKTKKSRKPPGS